MNALQPKFLGFISYGLKIKYKKTWSWSYTIVDFGSRRFYKRLGAGHVQLLISEVEGSIYFQTTLFEISLKNSLFI